MCRPGETPGFRPHSSRKSPWAFPGAEEFHPDKVNGARGEGFHPMPDEWLQDTVKPDTMLAFFGYNESFKGDAGLENFRGELDAWVKHTLGKQYNGTSAPRLVLISPIAFENLSASRDLPDGETENKNLENYTRTMSEVADANDVEFIDLFSGTRELYATMDEPFTRNGFLPNGRWLPHHRKPASLCFVCGEQALGGRDTRQGAGSGKRQELVLAERLPDAQRCARGRSALQALWSR